MYDEFTKRDTVVIAIAQEDTDLKTHGQFLKKFSTPPSFDLPAGTYSGEIRSFRGAVPLILDKADSGELHAHLGHPISPPRRVRSVPGVVPRLPAQLLEQFPAI